MDDKHAIQQTEMPTFDQLQSKMLMKLPLYRTAVFMMLLTSCEKSDDHVLAAFDVYCEMVASQAKPVALHYPMEEAAVDKRWASFEEIARKHKVKLYKENQFPDTGLFPPGAIAGKTVVIIYRGNSLTQYQQLKKDLEFNNGEDIQYTMSLARRMGRLLGYAPQGINDLLREQTVYRNLHQTEVIQQETHLYYKNPGMAIDFYGTTLGLVKTGDSSYHISEHAIITLHALTDAHPEGQPKSTAIAFLTDQLPAWYDYVQQQQIPIKYTYKPKAGGPHDGFVAIDPEGYLLEFEEFKQHSENEVLMSVLKDTKRMKTAVNDLHFFGGITWTYHQDVLKMQNFYQNVLGYRLVADQGWTKIFQTAESAFIGLVDERRGMENYAATKAVEITWHVKDRIDLDTYANRYWQLYQYKNGSFTGPEGYRYQARPSENL
ncbi:MAG: VOC family protein [Bacteroidota bacterium]